MIESLLRRGVYASAAEAVHSGLKQLREEQNATRVRAALQEAIDSTSRGQIVRGDFLNELAVRRLKQA